MHIVPFVYLSKLDAAVAGAARPLMSFYAESDDERDVVEETCKDEYIQNTMTIMHIHFHLNTWVDHLSF